ncbi:MAG: hypothetical protein ACM3JD_16280 [Rudaea sp.]
MIDQYLKPNVKRGAMYFAIIATIAGVIGRIPVLVCLALPVLCAIWLVLPFATGWLTAQWGRTMAATATPLAVQSSSPYATPAVDGAVAAGVGALVANAIVWVVGLLFDVAFAGFAAATGNDATGSALGLAASGIGGFFGIFIGAIVAAIAGAIGGAIYVIYTQSRATPAAPPPAKL